MATIHDVATMAKVSVATISRVINNPELVSAVTRQKVLKAIDELNYIPNSMARELVTKNTKLVGLLLPVITNTFTPTVVRSFSDAISKWDYNILIGITNNDPKIEMEYVDIMIQKRVGGIVLLGSRTMNTECNEMLRKAAKRTPVILMDYPPFEEMYSVMTDEEEGAYKAIKYLTSMGHKKIGFLNGSLDMTTYYYKRKGYERALRENGIQMEQKYMTTVDYDFNGGYTGGMQLMDLEEPPTAIFASGDQMAVGAYRAIQKTGRKIPDDVSVVGFSGSPLSGAVYPSLTTVSQYATELGGEAVKMLMAILQDKPVQKHIVLEPHIIVRESCCPPNSHLVKG